MHHPIPYPSWRYHREFEPCIVADALEDAALGPGWVDSPANVSAPAEPQPEPAAPQAEPVKRGPGRPRKNP